MKTKLQILGFLAVAALTAVFAQGPLTPPGAPAPTMKTLDQIEPRTPISALPFTISTPGSYYITGNLTGVAGQHGITINADNVTLDLGGFELVGPGSGVTTAIRLVNAHVNATIRHGTVRGWLSSGVVAETVAGTEMNVENLRVFGSGGGGIVLGNNGTAKGCEVRGNVAFGISGGASCKIIECTATGQTGAGGDGINVGSNGIILNCVASGNGSDGIQVGGNSTITGCTAANNGNDGITCGNACSLQNCSASDNTGSGFNLSVIATMNNCTAFSNDLNGIEGSTGITLTNCSSASNVQAGVVLGDDFSLSNFLAQSNGGNGITGGNGDTLTNCSALSNNGAAGIQVNSGCVLTGCSARANTSTLATSAGITTLSRCQLSQCSVSNSGSTAGTLTATTGMGLNVGADCNVERCTADANKGDGIHCGGGCRVISNVCNVNGNTTGDGAGIRVTAGDGRVDGNTVAGNDRGIEVDGAGSLIIKNDAASNSTDYVIAANNRYGAIINITATGTAAVSGNTAASTVASTDPWANFSH